MFFNSMQKSLPSAPKPCHQKGKLRSLLTRLLHWFMKTSEGDEPTADICERKLFARLNQYTPDELLARTQELISLLQSAKEELLRTHGKKAEYFAMKYIDRHIASLGQLQETVSSGTKLSMPSDSSELIQTLLGEITVGDLVQSALESNLHRAITNDISLILSCASGMSTELHSPAKRKTLAVINEKIQQTLSELQNLQHKIPASRRLSHLFSWKEAVDADRQRLHDVALATLDRIGQA